MPHQKCVTRDRGPSIISGISEQYVGSEMCQIAHAQGFVSIDRIQKASMLVHDARLARQVAAEAAKKEKEELDRTLPRELHIVVRAQASSGQWPVDNKALLEVLLPGHSSIPPAPEGIALWKWITCLCVAYLRRWPQYYDEIREVYEKGAFWVTNEAWLDHAKMVLPTDGIAGAPNESSKPQEPEIVPSSSHAPLSSTRDASPPPSVESATLHQKYIERTLWRANTLRDIGLSRLKMSKESDFKHGKRTAILNARQPLEECAPLYTELSNKLQAANEAAMQELLRQDLEMDQQPLEIDVENTLEDAPNGEIAPLPVNESPLRVISRETREALFTLDGMKGEQRKDTVQKFYEHECMLNLEYDMLCRKKGLGKLETAKYLAKEWEKPLSTSSERVRIVKELDYRKSVPWESSVAINRAEPKAAARRRVPKATPSSETKYLINDTPPKRHEIIVPPEQAPAFEKLNVKVRHAFEEAVRRIFVYESSREQLRKLLDECSAKYRAFTTHSERNHAFDDFTNEVQQIRIYTCSVLEGIRDWRRAKSLVEHFPDPDPKVDPLPFLWDTKNFVLSVAEGLNFFATSRELVEWYGSEMPLRNNPFMLAVTFQKRPLTPRSATEKVYVDNKMILRVNPAMVELRIKEEELLNEAWSSCCSGPTWWPQCSKDLWYRVRTSEKLILQEIRLVKNK